MDDDLKIFREQLNIIDKVLIQLLEERFAICRNVSEYKKKNSIPVMQPQRIQEILDKVEVMSLRNSVIPYGSSKAIYTVIIEEVCKMEENLQDSKNL